MGRRIFGGRVWVTVCASAAIAVGGLLVRPLHAQTEPQQNATAAPAPKTDEQLATVEQLKTEAFKALKGGNFARSDELLRAAASMSGDRSLAQMSQWLASYETQRSEFTAERHKQYDKAVADVHKLIDGGKLGFAIDRAKDAAVLADDRSKFSSEPWVKDLIDRTLALAQQYQKDEQWLKVLRLYSDLNAVEQTNPEWKEQLKLATRRVRLLAMYTPDEFKAIGDAEIKEREEADALLKEPTTQPTTAPATNPSSLVDNDAFKVDWHDTLRGVNINMLYDALEDAKTNYWRDTNYKALLTGGLKGVQAILTTKGLEKAFPGLSDAKKRDTFAALVQQNLDLIGRIQRPDDEQFAVKRTISNLRIVNRQTVQLPDEVLINEFADGAFGELDPFSNMIWPSDLDDFNKSTQGEFGGVGIQIDSDEGELRVVTPLEDTPAYRLGIKAGDTITKINGKGAKGISTTMAVKTITGTPGTEVTLTIRSGADGTEKDYTIRREIINVASVKGWKRVPGGAWDYFIDPQLKIGYLRLTNFTKHSSGELKEAVAELQKQGARGLILDLRYNPGGLLASATDICDKFLGNGTIVSTRADRDNPAQPPQSTEARPSDDDCELPMVVLVNGFSASASEIVSGALKDQHRAIIVGERTFGKGSVQMLFSLAGRTAYLKLTTSHYYLPSGRCIHKEDNSTTWGVDPDVIVQMTPQQMNEAAVARKDSEVIRDINAPKPAPSTNPTTKPAKKDPLEADPQLSAGLLVLRLKLSGATL